MVCTRDSRRVLYFSSGDLDIHAFKINDLSMNCLGFTSFIVLVLMMKNEFTILIV